MTMTLLYWRARTSTGALLTVALLTTLLAFSTERAEAQGGQVTINEIVASNSTTTDNFGATPDWIELRNSGASIDLSGWTLSDDDAAWTLPNVTLGGGGRLLIWASDRNLAGPQLHTNFKLAASGETVRLARPDGSVADTITYPALAEDRAYGSDENGGVGYLVAPTPNAANTALAPGIVTIETPAQAFTGTLSVALSADLGAGNTLRYTSNGDAVTSGSLAYAGPIAVTESTVLRAAVVSSDGTVGPERTAGYIAVTSALATRSSDIPMVLVQSAGPVGNADTGAIVTVIDRSVDGRAYVLGDADYTGFAGLRLRGSSSAGFPKKQYKFELWDNPAGDSRDGSLLGLGTDDDWGLYAPGRMDRAMIPNPFIYELGHRIGLPSPDYQFVELWLEDEIGSALGEADYRGLYLLRETIEIDDERVDVAKHTPTSAGPDGGYIVLYDRVGDCCSTIHPLSGSLAVVQIDDPGAGDITPAQLSWVDAWFDELLAAAATQDYAQLEPYFEMDSIIDYWLLQMLSGEPDALVLSAYLAKDAGGGLQAGSMWDFDRAMGSVDSRTNDLSDAQRWGSTDKLITSSFWGDLWLVPEVQAQLRARWAELRGTHFSDTAIVDLTNALRDEIVETYPRELTVWNSNGYGPRFGNGLFGEVDYLQQWMQLRLDWMDGQLSSNSNPSVTNPGTQTIAESTPFSLQLQVSGGSAFDYRTTDLPAGLTMSESGLISGTVAFGDAETRPITITVTNESGGSTEVTFTIDVTPSFTGPAAVILNEYNAVIPGALLDLNGTDTALGRIDGNGGDWFEIVVTQDHLDMRGWRFDLFTNGLIGVAQTAALKLNDDDLFADVRAGTIITIAESIPDDLSYDPANDDWTINLQSNNQQQGAMWANQTSFDTNNTKWRLVIRDEALAIRGPIAGEIEPWDDVNFGVSGAEVMHLAIDPTATPNVVTDYADTVNSSFGEPNPLGGGVQNFDAIRPDVQPPGEVTCNSVLDDVDALFVVQFGVGNRTDAGTCPLPDPATEINANSADINDDGNVDAIDALIISQCAAGILDSGLCPAE